MSTLAILTSLPLRRSTATVSKNHMMRCRYATEGVSPITYGHLVRKRVAESKFFLGVHKICGPAVHLLEPNDATASVTSVLPRSGSEGGRSNVCGGRRSHGEGRATLATQASGDADRVTTSYAEYRFKLVRATAREWPRPRGPDRRCLASGCCVWPRYRCQR